MMKKYLILSLVLVLLSCEKEKLYDGVYCEYISQEYLDSDIEFFPSENYYSYDIGEPELVLKFYTTQIFPCINYSIRNTSYVQGDELIVRFEGVNTQKICLTAVGPASAQIPLTDNIEKLVLLNGDQIDIYDVTITENEVEIKESIQTFSEVRYSIIFRYPANSFVFSGKRDEKNLALYNTFLETMLNNFDLSEFDFEGEGRIPYAEDSEDEIAKYFTYNNEQDFYNAGEMFRQYIIENTEKDDYIYIEMINWKNEKYLSWMFYD